MSYLDGESYLELTQQEQLEFDRQFNEIVKSYYIGPSFPEPTVPPGIVTDALNALTRYYAGAPKDRASRPEDEPKTEVEAYVEAIGETPNVDARIEKKLKPVVDGLHQEISGIRQELQDLRKPSGVGSITIATMIRDRKEACLIACKVAKKKFNKTFGIVTSGSCFEMRPIAKGRVWKTDVFLVLGLRTPNPKDFRVMVDGTTSDPDLIWLRDGDFYTARFPRPFLPYDSFAVYTGTEYPGYPTGNKSSYVEEPCELVGVRFTTEWDRPQHENQRAY